MNLFEAAAYINELQAVLDWAIACAPAQRPEYHAELVRRVGPEYMADYEARHANDEWCKTFEAN
jgi:hypothetical protein